MNSENMQDRDRNAGESIERISQAAIDMKQQLRRVIVGQDEVIEQLLIAIFSGGHALVVGVPGLAKTLLIRTIAES